MYNHAKQPKTYITINIYKQLKNAIFNASFTQTIKAESIKLQPNDNFLGFDLTVFIFRFCKIFCHVFCFIPKLSLHKINLALN